MEIKIDLDMNQIDYDAINKQIQEKIAALDVKDMYNVETKIDNTISDYIKSEINCSYNKYLDSYFWGRNSETSEGKKLIENISKEEIERRTKNIIDDIFENAYDEEKLRELMFKFLPDIFTTLLFRKMENALFSKEHDYQNQMYNMTRSIISTEFNKMRY